MVVDTPAFCLRSSNPSQLQTVQCCVSSYEGHHSGPGVPVGMVRSQGQKGGGDAREYPRKDVREYMIGFFFFLRFYLFIF